jgi:hypothetical protein
MGKEPSRGETRMNRILISVEGQTEETFVKEVLRNHLSNFNVYPDPIVLNTKVTKQGNKFKGGLLSYSQARNDIRRLLLDTNAVAISTMYDYYHLPNDFPGYSTLPNGNCFLRIQHLETELRNSISNYRFKPYFQIHEFEALLFVDTKVTASMFPERCAERELNRIKSSFNSPEEINDGPTTAPSKRILNIFPNYNKELFGSLITLTIGLDSIRNQCQHFNEWLTWLENLG